MKNLSTTWPLRGGRPSIQVEIEYPTPLLPRSKVLLADTGAGTAQAASDLLLGDKDCQLAAYRSGPLVRLTGAFSGEFKSYIVKLRIPELNYSSMVLAVGIGYAPPGFDGIATFRLLNRFTYGNFGDPKRFGLEFLPSR